MLVVVSYSRSSPSCALAKVQKKCRAGKKCGGGNEREDQPQLRHAT